MFHLLTQKFGTKVTWMNESGEENAPYDLMIGENHYIEVKSTSSATLTKAPFPMSKREIDFACGVEKYDVYRVFGIEQEQPQVVVIDNIGTKIRNKQVTICLQP